LRSLLPPFAVLALASLAACDNPKPRPVDPPDPAANVPAAAPAPTAAGASAGLPGRPEMAGFYLDAINEAQDPVNRPATISVAGPVTFSGFGFDPVAKQPGAAVDLMVDGVAYSTTYGHARTDVASYFKAPALVNTGFTVTLPAGAVRPGRHQAIVRVVSADKTAYFDSVVIGFVAK
jgi:hypothetical protein